MVVLVPIPVATEGEKPTGENFPCVLPPPNLSCALFYHVLPPNGHYLCMFSKPYA